MSAFDSGGGAEPDTVSGDPTFEDDLSEAAIQRRVGQKIRDLRVARDMRATELAALADISQGQLSKIETGKATLSIKLLARLCEVLDRPLSYLFQSEREMPRTFGVVGTLNTVEGPESQGVRRFVEELARATGNRLSFVPLRAPQAGRGRDQIGALRDGLIDLFIEDLALYQEIAPALGVLSLPYGFTGDAHLHRFLDSALFEEQAVRPLRQRGVRLIGSRWNWRRGVEWVVASTRPVFEPDDLKGRRVRVRDEAVQIDFWREMGAEPVVVPWPEVGAALARGEVDAVPTHKAHLYPLGFCRTARYVTLLGDLSPVLGVGVNEAKYQALPPDLQAALDEACDRAGDIFSEIVRTAEADNEGRNVAQYGAVYIRTPQTPWSERIAATRATLVARGTLFEDVWREIERLR